MKELVSKRTRRAFQEHLVCWVLREIVAVFEDEYIVRGEEQPNVQGARRGLVASYYATVDWSSPVDVGRLLRVYEAILDRTRKAFPEGYDDLVAYLARDGYHVDGAGRLRGGAWAMLATMPLACLTDPAVILEHFDRITEAVDRDPSHAIGAAKELVESTCKLVLKELDEPYESKWDVARLTKTAQKSLGLHPDVLAGDAANVEAVRAVLGALSGIAVGLAQLRNSAGTGHGRERPSSLGSRHAHLAVGAAATYCRFLLETLAAPSAPWRRRTLAS